MTDAALLEAVEKVARIGGEAALRRFRSRVRIDQKADGSPVTEADRDAERRMREWIGRRFPDDGIVGEELGEQRGAGTRRWILDPIDGTRSFVAGAPYWGTLVGVTVGTRVVAGAIYCPVSSELVCAARGTGCWYNGARASVSSVRDISEARVALNDCYGYLLVAVGKAEIMLDPVMSLWDIAALQPVIEEAGGVFTDWEGRQTAFGDSAIATNRALAKQARALITGVGTVIPSAGTVIPSASEGSAVSRP